MARWKLAPAIAAMFEDANDYWPDRSKASDGTIGDQAHRNRKSAHNPDEDGYVTAGDLTHDPAHGVDCNVLAERAIEDVRVSLVIWNRRIWSRARASEGWRRYSGTNPHDKHMHVEVLKAYRADNRRWFPAPTAPPKEDEVTYLLLPPANHKHKDDVLVTNDITARHVNDPAELKRLTQKYGSPVRDIGQLYDDLWAARVNK